MSGKIQKLIRKETRNLEKTKDGRPNVGLKNFRKYLKKLYAGLNWKEKTNFMLKHLKKQ